MNRKQVILRLPEPLVTLMDVYITVSPHTDRNAFITDMLFEKFGIKIDATAGEFSRQLSDALHSAAARATGNTAKGKKS